MNDVASIFRMYGEAYRRQHPLPLHILKTMSAIEQCRTAALGGHVDECDHCGHLRISYNSCRNRNRKSKLQICKELLGINIEEEDTAAKSWQELLLELTGIDTSICPCCKEGTMISKETLYPERCGPPEDIDKVA